MMLAIALIGCKNRNDSDSAVAGDAGRDIRDGNVFTITNTDKNDVEDVIISWVETDSFQAGSKQILGGECVAVPESLFPVLTIEAGIGGGDTDDPLQQFNNKTLCGGDKKSDKACEPDHYIVSDVGEGAIDKMELSVNPTPKKDWSATDCPAVNVAEKEQPQGADS